MRRVLFVCGRNRWRSPTAEEISSAYPGLECASAGVSADADSPLTPELLGWATIIVVMERKHKSKLASRFPAALANKQVVCLDIPDKYRFMDPALVELLKARAVRFNA